MPRTELLFSVIPEVTDHDDNLTHQPDPERHRRERTVLETIANVPEGKVREHQLPGNSCPGYDDYNGTQHLGEGQSRADVETRESLEKDHTQTHSLDSVENSQPEPQRNADPGSGTSRPWNVQSNGRDSPEHLHENQ